VVSAAEERHLGFSSVRGKLLLGVGRCLKIHIALSAHQGL
jgi:hypothetical protein